MVADSTENSLPSSHNPHNALKPLSSTGIPVLLALNGIALLDIPAVARGWAGLPGKKEKTAGTHLLGTQS